MEIGLVTDRLDYGICGIGNYVYNITRQLLKLDKENEYTLIHLKPQDLQKPYHDIFVNAQDLVAEPPKLENITSSLLESRASEHIPFNWKNIYEKLENVILKRVLLPRVLKEKNFDLIHEMSQLIPLSYSPALEIVTIHDTIPFLNTEDFNKELHTPAKIFSSINSQMLMKLMKKNIHVITISNASKKDIMRIFGISADKIFTVYYGIDDKIFKPLNISKGIIIRKYGIIDPYILYVGSLEPRKNVYGLIQAFKELKRRKIQYKLVIASALNQYYPALLRFLKELNLTDNVMFIGHAPPSSLVELYNGADLFVFPSLHEGFGLPPLEAMACGTPVVTSNTSSLPEVVGDAGIKVNPRDIKALAEAMYDVLIDGDLRRKLSEKSLIQARKFSWKRAAEDTLRIYETVFGAHREVIDEKVS